MHREKIFAALLLIIVAPVPCFSQAVSTHQKQLQLHLQKAQRDLAERKPDLAIPELRAIIALDPDNVYAHGNLGVLLFFRNDYAGATPQLQAALRLQPDLWKIQALLGISDERLGKRGDGRQNLEAAFPHLQEEKIKIEVGKALIDDYTSTRDLDKAATVISDLLKLEPTNTDLLYTSYRIHSDLADEAILTVAMTAPDSAQMHEMMARALAKEGDSAAAIANYRKALHIDPKIPALHFQLAELLYDSGTVEGQKEAVTEYKAALALNPMDERSESELGKIAAQNGDTATAYAYYSKAVKLRPDDAIALTGLAKILIVMQQPTKALPLLERAVQLDPTSAAAHFRLSTIYRHEGRSADAKRELDEYLKFKKMQAELTAIFKQMRLPPARDTTGGVDTGR